MTLLFAIPAFLAFVLYVESAELLSRFKAFKQRINKTFGRAYWVYPTTRKQQEWMRYNII